MTARRQRSEKPARLSYLTAILSGALVLGLLVYLIVHAVSADRPALIVAEVLPDSVWAQDSLAYVAVDVRNLGDRPATMVIIETEASGAAAPETATIDYLAGGERQRVYVMVPSSADRSDMTSRVVTFQEP